MTDHAILQHPHKQLPDGIPEWSVDFEYLVFPWACPVCELVVAQSVIQERKPEVRTLVVGVRSPTRQADADVDGVPYYGPTRRAMQHRSERAKPHDLSSTSWRRARNSREYRRNLGDPARRGTSPMPSVDHQPIEDHEFDSLCTNCPRRLRFRLPSP